MYNNTSFFQCLHIHTLDTNTKKLYPASTYLRDWEKPGTKDIM